ncbi:serine carboxypeptidase S28 [Cercophora scortea]|uniref:Serine carboxypeptidase S28 n=1 Tax=Cercophora scortea TaxID=314031 RepID=A0AAE0ILI7_9PEZI|nr:serine carboxypeptidase S28 [Cercophora scortea]
MAMTFLTWWSAPFEGPDSQTQAAQLWPPLAPPPLAAAVSAAPLGGNTTFQQLIDHSDPSLGTFPQTFWWDTTFWAGPGSPVLLFTPGEVDAEDYTGYITNRTLMGLYAQAMGGAMILLEHRYWGKSTPFEVLDTKNLSYLTLENSVADLVHFARTVELPFDANSTASNAPNSPWINVGGSYAGALAAWTEKLSPNTFWAYHASSGPVQAVYDYWEYFLPIQRGMPQNCSADMSRIVDYIDGVFDSGNDGDILELKTMFGLEELSHVDDVAAAIGTTLGAWQGIQVFSNYSMFFQMCDTIEGVRPIDKPATNTTTNATSTPAQTTPVPAAGVGLEKALRNFAGWFKRKFLPDNCGSYKYRDWSDPNSVGCFDTYNISSPYALDWAPNNTVNRQWMWMICNQPFFYWQTGAPKDKPSIISRYVTAEYYQRQCDLLFPAQGNATFGSAGGRKTAETVNAQTDGWLLTNTTRLLWVNGEFDPWRSASVSSEVRPGGPLQSTPAAPVFLIPGARHCNDLITMSGTVNADIHETQNAVVAQMVRWVDEFYHGKG